MFSTSEDGTIAVWKAGSWECLRILKGHKYVFIFILVKHLAILAYILADIFVVSNFRGPVYHFAVHPSGKLGLSVSKDRTMKTWNLITMRCAYTTNIKDG